MRKFNRRFFNRLAGRFILAGLCVLQLSTFIVPVRSAYAVSAPNVLNYQGRVLNSNGIPVADASVSMIFELYTAVSGGSCVWSNSSATCATATARTVTLTDGLFSEVLGDTVATYAAISDATFSDNGTLYLQVTVGGELLTPRKQLAAAPYAMNSDTLDGLDSDTDGATTSALVALSSAGNVVFTGDPTGATVSTGVMYVNPAAAGADETILGVGDNGSDRFRVDKEGDVFIKGIELDGAGGSNVTSGASLIGTYDEFDNSNATTIQDVLDDFDTVIGGLAVGSSKWTDAGAFTYLTSDTDDVVIGDTTVAGASFYFDEGAGQLDLGTDNTLAGTIRLYSATAATADPTLAADASGNLDLSATVVELTGDLAVNGGDITSTAGTLTINPTGSGIVQLGTDDNLNTTGDISVVLDSTDDMTVARTQTTDDNTYAAKFTYLNSSATDVSDKGVLSLVNTNDGGATGVTNYGLVITNLDANEALTNGISIQNNSTGTITTGLLMSAAAGSITTGIDLTNTGIGDAISIGNNDITGTTFDLIGTTGTIDFTNFDVASTGDITTAGDLAVNGGDLTSTSATFNLLSTASTTVNSFDAATTVNLNDAVVTSTIDIGGVTSSGTNTVNIATNGTAADGIAIGNTNAATTVAITGGDDWSMTGAGVLTMSASAAATTAIVITDTDYTNALSIGDNDITGTTFDLIGTTGTIDFTNFDVASTGAITVAAGVGLDTNGAGALALGNTNATSATICNSAACDTLLLGSNADADTITIGDAASDTTTLNGSTVAIDSGSWDVTTVGVASGLTGLTTTGNVTVSGAQILGASPLVFEGTTDDNITTTFTITDPTVGNKSIVFQNASGTVAFLSDTLSTTLTDNVTDALDIQEGTNNYININTTNTSENISFGNATTNPSFSFLGSGAITAAGDLAVNGGDLTSTSATFNLLSTASTTVNSFDAATTVNINDAVVTSTIDIGGVTSSGTNTINIATNGTAADGIAIGNTNAATTVAMTGGDDWSMTGAGVLTMSASAAATTAIVITDTDYTNALSIGDNDITGTTFDLIGTTGTIDFTNFDVASTGEITVAGGQGIDTNAAGILRLGQTNATSLAMCNSAACDNIAIGTNADADIILIGDSSDNMALNEDNWSITAPGVATFTGFACPDCLDFTELADSLTLDANTSITQSGTQTLTFTNNGSGAVTVDLNSTGDFITRLDNIGANFYVNNGSENLFTVAASGTDDGVSVASAVDLANSTFVVLNDATTTGYVSSVQGHGLTSGSAFSVASSGSALTSGDIFVVTNSGTRTATGTISGSVEQLSRSIGNNSGGALNITGPVLNITSNNTNISGTLTDSATLLSLAQSNTASTGSLATLSQTGTGDGIGLTMSGTGYGINIANSSTGPSIFVNPSGESGTSVNTTAGGAVHIENSDNDNYGLTVYSNNGATVASPLAFVFADNAAYDVNVSEIRNDSTAATSSALVITQEVVANATTTATSQALVIKVNESQNSDEVILIVSDADGTPDAEFRFENDGDLFGDGGAYNSGADYAEFFYTVDSALGAHEVVCQDLENNLAVKTCELGDPTVVGVVSTSPGFVGNNIPGAEGSLEDNPNYRIVGLEGQIETYVTAADGAIAIGDALTASSFTAGYAGKATAAGRVVGFALEALSSGSGLITVRVSPGWDAGSLLADDGSLTSVGSTLALESLSTATASSPASNSNVLTFRGSAWNGSAAQTVAMTLSNRVTSSGAYRLSVGNNTGSEVAYINNLGDLVLSGKLYPSDQGSAQTSAYVYYDSQGVGYMRTNAAGWGTGSYDFAEMFPAPEPLSPGDVVVFGDESEQVKRSTGQTYDQRIAGVVSTRPGFLAGTYKAGDQPIALSGRVPTRVTNENGAIMVGDPLTTSSVPGVAMKATESGSIVGYAMQPFSGVSGMITVFIRASYYDSGESPAPVMVAAPVSEVNTTGNLSSLSLNGGAITSVASIAGLGNTWRLNENGDLITHGRLVQVVKSHQNEDVETYAAASRQMTIQLSGTTTLVDNTAIVNFESIDPQFNDIISTTSAYRVIATPSGVTGQIYVTDRTTSGFTVHAENAANGVLVDWLVIAEHKDYIAQEVEEVSEPVPVVEEVVETVTEPTPETVPVGEVAGTTDEVPPADTIVIGPTAELVVEIPSIEPALTEPIVVEAPVETLLAPDPIPEITL